MAQAEQARDPSMEEILASIRKIIAEDSADPLPTPPPHLSVVPRDEPEAETVAAPKAESKDVDDFDAAKSEAKIEPVIPHPDEPPPEGGDDLAALADEVLDEPIEDEEVADTAAEGSGDSTSHPSEPEAQDPPRSDPPDLGAAITAAMEARAAKTKGPDTSPTSEHAEPPAGRLLSPQADQAVHAAFNQLAGTILSDQSRTLEDLVKDMMRPMLKHWLDDNLPVLVERLVREEIERVSRGRR